MRKPALWNERRRYFEARRAIPEDLRPIIGKNEFRENVGANKREAERRAIALQNRWEAELEEARARLDALKPTISTAAKTHYRAELQADDNERRGPGRSALADLNAVSRPIYASRLRLVAAGQIVGEEAEALIGHAANTLHAKGIAPAVPRAELLKTLAEVQLEAMTQFEARDKGMMIAPEPKLAVLTEPDPEPATPAQKAIGTGATLSDVLTAFHKERGTTLAPRTVEEHKRAVTYFQHVIGELPARAITKQHVLDFKQALLDAPAAFENKPDLRGLTLPQATKANQKREAPYPAMSATTINNKYLAHVKTVMQWGSVNGFLDINPATGVRVDEGKRAHKEPSRVPFDHDDLEAIFGHEMFASPTTYGEKQWALLLALYTGARTSSELARLKVANVYADQGVTVMHLADASKNVRSKRLVPVHRDLVRLGFVKYVAAKREAGETHVFPGWAANTKTINDWVGRTFLPSLGINDPRKVFHSFRHNFKTALARHGVPRDVQDAITGHADQSAAAGYIHAEPIKAMSAGLNRVTFDLPIHK